ncbi:MAG: four helix bundle protein [Chloroflexi bacterium]|nr:four helix bundle protein [Chloroflexota bacterium]
MSVNAPAKDHRDLRVYQLAFESAVRVYETTKSFPPEERYSLTDQIRRSSRSVCTNIAEAWRKRRYPNHFASKLSDADAEATETIVWLDFAFRFGFVSADLHRELIESYNLVCRQLTVMMSQPHKWTPKP